MTDKNKLKGLPLWGAVVGLIGGIFGILGGGISLWDRFIPPQVEVFGVKPVAISESLPLLGTEDSHTAYGISAIVHLRNKNRTAVIGGLDLDGKIYLSVNEYLGNITPEGRHIEDIASEVGEKKPYYLISWNGWPANPKVAIHLAPFEERYVAFTFYEPTLLSGKSEVGIDYYGEEKSLKIPVKKTTKPEVFDIFKPQISKDKKYVYPNGLRDEIKNGLSVFKLRVGPNSLVIPASKVQEFLRLKKEDWQNLPPSRLYYQGPY